MLVILLYLTLMVGVSLWTLIRQYIRSNLKKRFMWDDDNTATYYDDYGWFLIRPLLTYRNTQGDIIGYQLEGGIH